MSLTAVNTTGSAATGRTSPPVGTAQPRALLVARLGEALGQGGVRYCQWKGHAKRGRWETGESDVDLLVDRAHADQFAAVMQQLGFKLALPPRGRETAGLLSYLGHDPALRRPIHVHVHYELLVGRPWARHYRLPIERAVLDSAIQRTWLKTPSPELELLLLVLHSALRLRSRDVLQRREPYWFRALQPGLTRLEEEANAASLARAIGQVPELDRSLFVRCRRTLEPGAPRWRDILARFSLERALRAYARTGPLTLRLRHLLALVARALGNPAPRLERTDKHLATGGALLALVGTDGSGKTSCGEALHTYLSHELLATRLHLGRPPRTLTTLAVGGALKLARRLEARAWLVSLLELARHVATARDRYRLYLRARRFQAEGGIAICDRYPIPESYALAGPSTYQQEDGPQARGRAADWLRRIEARYYARIGRPDITLILRIDPETAVRRKTDEPADYVRRRAQLLERASWPASAIVVDASQGWADVVREVRARVWQAL